MSEMKHDMRHLDFIRQVAEADLAYIDKKDRSYGGSWKRSGGRSAWFMLRRKIDRLLEFMKRPDTPEDFNLQNVDDTLDAVIKAEADPRASHWVVNLPGVPHATHAMLKYLRDSYLSENIFAKIRENPDGSDGTVLAEVRDLRRYLLLVEAEMMARGVVQQPTTLKVIPASGGSLADTMREERRVPRFEPEKRHTFAVGEEVNFKAGANTTYTGTILKFFPDSKMVRIRAVQADGRGADWDVMLDDLRKTYEATNKVSSEGERFIPETQAEHAAWRPGTPEDGGQHTNMKPWELHSPPLLALADFYKVAALNIWRLEPFVTSHTIPRQLAPYYTLCSAAEDRWAIKIDMVPEELRDCYPRLQRELNAKEYDDHAQKYMYYHDSGSGKYLLSKQHGGWGRDE